MPGGADQRHEALFREIKCLARTQEDHWCLAGRGNLENFHSPMEVFHVASLMRGHSWRAIGLPAAAIGGSCAIGALFACS